MRIKIQEDVKDCGLVILQAFYKKFYKKWLSINEFKKNAFYNKDGISINNLEILGINFGLHLESFQGDFKSLLNLNLTEPIIILINIDGMNHYVILSKKTKEGFQILDPLLGSKFIKKEEMEKFFLNTIIIIKKAKNHKIIKRISIFKEIFPILFNWLSLIIIISSLISSITLILSSFYMKIIFDKVIQNESLTLLIHIFWIFFLLLIFKIWNTYNKIYFLKKLNIQIEQKLLIKYINSLKNIDLNYMNKITYNDNLRRINLISSIADFLANFVFSILSELVLLFFGFFMLLFINLNLFVLVTIGNFLIIFISYFYQKVVNKNYKKFLSINLEEFSSQMNLVQNIFNLKIHSKSDYFLNNFYQKYYQKKKLDFKIFKWNTFNNLLISSISQIIPLLIIFIGMLLFLEKKISLGNILIFTSFFHFYLTPLKSFSELILKIPIFQNDYEHFLFISKGKMEFKNQQKNILEKINSLSFENFLFSYDNDKNIFKIKKFIIKDDIKILGKNGIGKSTFLKSIALQNYCLGNYFINNININDLSWKQIRSKIIYLNSNNFIPNDTIFSFITENNEEKIKQFFLCFKKYNFQKLFDDVNLNISEIIENNGINFSSGQRQIIFIMQLFTKKYNLIMLDEIFENISVEILNYFKTIIFEFQNEAIFIEISHNQKFISNGKEINFEDL